MTATGEIWVPVDIFQSVMLAQGMVQARGPVGWLGLGVFALYKAISVLGMRQAVRAVRASAPARLLLLRVFGRRRRSERLFDLLAARWRYAGSIQMIGAPDLAGSTLGPSRLLDFLGGRLRQRFIFDPADLPARLTPADTRCDIDARHRVIELFCGNDVWQAAVRALMARSDLVAMDLRSFSQQNQGCLYELQALLNDVAVERIVLLVDANTDQMLLSRTLGACATCLGPQSPNRDRAASVTLLDVSAGELAAVAWLQSRGDSLMYGDATASALAEGQRLRA